MREEPIKRILNMKLYRVSSHPSNQFKFLTLLMFLLQWPFITAEDADRLQNAKLRAVNLLLK